MTRQNDIDILAKTIYGEARGESPMGKMAIACVVMNRYKAKKWFSRPTIAETCQYCVKGSKWHQFSCWNEGDPSFKAIQKATEVQLAPYKEIAEKFVDGVEKDFLCGACHYHAINVYPKWAFQKQPDFLIGHHLFYCGID